MSVISVKKIPEFSKMSKDYQDDVYRKLSELEPLSESIYQDLRTRFKGGGYILSMEFRKKGLQRIVEKDVTDYAGVDAFETQVKDIFAARLCPSRHDDSLSDDQIKDNLQSAIKVLYKGKKIRVTVENKTLKNGMNVRYIVFADHIELQILTLKEYHILEDTHKEYEDRRTGSAGTVSAPTAVCTSMFLILIYISTP
jgi:hypothetical protein